MKNTAEQFAASNKATLVIYVAVQHGLNYRVIPRKGKKNVAVQQPLEANA